VLMGLMEVILWDGLVLLGNQSSLMSNFLLEFFLSFIFPCYFHLR